MAEIMIKFYIGQVILFLSILNFTLFQVKATENFTISFKPSDISNGFGDSYLWYTLEEGLTKARSEGKPLMIIIHKIDCGACRAFKAKFSSSEYILKLSGFFVMVNIKEQDVREVKFSPDGTYVPRVFFLDERGSVQLDIFNKHGNPEYKYFYHDMIDLIASMKKVISKLVTFNTYDEL